MKTKKTTKKTNAKKSETKKPYGIKAYGKWTRFATAEEYEKYLNEWIAGTDGHEQDRAIKALSDLLVGVKTTDTDKMPEAVPVPKPEPKPEPKPAAEDKLAKRRERARAYYAAHREKLVEASRRSHAKRAAEAKELMNEAFDMLQGIASEREYDWFAKYGDPSVIGRLAAFLKREA